MYLNMKKGLMVVFMLITLVSTIAFSYTMYLWIGIAGALRNVEENVKIDRVEVEISEGNKSISLDLSIYNPSEFFLCISYVAVKEVMVDGIHAKLYFGSSQFSGTFNELDRELEPFSNESISFKFDCPSPLQNVSNYENWVLHMLVHVTTAFTEKPIAFNILGEYEQA